MTILRLIAGFALIGLGRQLFWLFVGGVGFVLGLDLAAALFRGSPQAVIVLIALGVGLLGALLAIFLQQFAVSVAGFLAGGYILTNLLGAMRIETGVPLWIIFIVGGIIGSILIMTLFDWALIVLSSVAGATVIVRTLPMDPGVSLFIFMALLIVGIATQAYSMRRRKT